MRPSHSVLTIILCPKLVRYETVSGPRTYCVLILLCPRHDSMILLSSILYSRAHGGWGFYCFFCTTILLHLFCPVGLEEEYMTNKESIDRDRKMIKSCKLDRTRKARGVRRRTFETMGKGA